MVDEEAILPDAEAPHSLPDPTVFIMNRELEIVSSRGLVAPGGSIKL